MIEANLMRKGVASAFFIVKCARSVLQAGFVVTGRLCGQNRYFFLVGFREKVCFIVRRRHKSSHHELLEKPQEA